PRDAAQGSFFEPVHCCALVTRYQLLNDLCAAPCQEDSLEGLSHLQCGYGFKVPLAQCRQECGQEIETIGCQRQFSKRRSLCLNFQSISAQVGRVQDYWCRALLRGRDGVLVEFFLGLVAEA